MIFGLLVVAFVLGLMAGWLLCSERLDREYRMLDRSWAQLNRVLEGEGS